MRLTRPAAAAAAIVLLAAAGCGTSSNSLSKRSPKTELAGSFLNLTKGSTLTTTIRFNSTAADLLAIDKASGSTGKNKLTPQQARMLAGAQLVVEAKAPAGTKLSNLTSADSERSDAQIFAVVDNDRVIEFRVVHGTLYLRADVAKFLDIAGQPRSELTKVKSQIPPQIGFARSVIDGKWVSLSLSAAKALSSQVGGSTATPDANQQRKLRDAFKSLLDRDVAVTRISSGNDGDHLKLTAHSRTLVHDLMAAVSSNVPGAGSGLSGLGEGKVPDKLVTVDAWVNHDVLSRLSLDLHQFASGTDAKQLQGKQLALTVDLAPSGDAITAPSGATPVDLSKLLPLLTGLRPGAMTPLSG